MEADSEIIKLDKKNEQLLEFLKENSRQTYKQLAKKIHLSHDAIAYRIKRLEEKGVIEKYSLKINYALLGFNEYHILFQHVENKPEKTEKFYAYLEKNRNIVNVIYYSDKWDLKVVVLVKNSLELDEILTDLNNKFSDILQDQQILEKIRDCLEDREELQGVKLDKTDKKIINLLSENSRMSLVQIAGKVNLNADTIVYRLKRYQNQKLIRKFTTEINPNKVGLYEYTLLLLMKVFTAEEEKKLKNYFNKDPNLVGVIKTIGEWNLVLKVLARNPREFYQISKKIKLLLNDSLKDYDALLAYKELKNVNFDFSE